MQSTAILPIRHPGRCLAGLLSLLMFVSGTVSGQEPAWAAPLKVARDAKADPAAREKAVQAISALPDRVNAVPGLVPLLSDKQLGPQVQAIIEESGAVKQIAVWMADPVVQGVDQAVIGMIYAKIPGAAEQCLQMLDSKDGMTRRRALNVYLARNPRALLPPDGLNKLLGILGDKCMTDTNLLSRLDTIQLASVLGLEASALTPALAARLKGDASTDVRTAAAAALAKVGGATNIPPLVEALSLGDDDVRYAAAVAISSLGPPAVEPLGKLLESGQAEVRRYAAFALARLGPDAAPASPGLKKLLKDADERVRRNAADALGRTGDASALSDLKKLADDPSSEVRLAAAGALKILASGDKSIAPVLERIGEKNRQKPGYLSLAKGDKPAKDGSGVLVPKEIMVPYPTHHGEPPGYPGCIPGVLNDKGEPKYPKWGQPQFQPYPGSVENYRIEVQKYTHPWPPFNQQTLVKNFRATELPEASAAVTDYAEPVYYTPMYGQSVDTGKRNPPVKVVRMQPGKPAFALDLGTLDIGLYLVRIVGAVEGPMPAYRKGLFVEFQVNDRPDDPKAMQRYRLRAGYADDFYSLAEFHFYAPQKRAYRATLAVAERSEVSPLVYNIDLHNVLAGLDIRPIKQQTVLITPPERDAARARYRQNLAEKKQLFALPPGWPQWRPSFLPVPPEERLRRDRALWNAFPPLNRGIAKGYSMMPYAASDWRPAGDLTDPFSLRHTDLGLVYTEDDFLNYRPLPDPYPFKDDGNGVVLPRESDQPYSEVVAPIGDAVRERMQFYSYVVNGHAAHKMGLADMYAQSGDEGAARDGALMLCRLAYALQVQDCGRTHIGYAIVGNTPDLNWGGKEFWSRRRQNRINTNYGVNICRSYDMLFEYIRGNQELAAAVGRFIPWVKAPEDVVAFLDGAVQFHARTLTYYRYHSDFSEDMIETAMALGDWEYTRPWMEWVFRDTWRWPHYPAGVDDYALNGTSRDGTSYIGSWMYAGDRPARDIATLTETYVRAGGLKQFDLSDPKRNPKALAGCVFDFEGRAAGMHTFGVGDVHGPNVPPSQWFNFAEKSARLGWKWSRDPRFAYVLANYYPQKDLSDAENKEIQAAAKDVPNPWFANRSRVLSSWGGILESGVEHNDFRFRRAAFIRTGYGWGHQHDDTLDMILWCHGVIHAADGGERPEKRNPDEVKGPADQKSYVHNVVEVDGDGSNRSGNWRGYSWVAAMKDTAGARYLDSVAAPGINHSNVTLFRRQTALVDVDEGKPSTNPPAAPKDMLPGAKLDANVVTPDAYLFDVFRVSGGKRHTYCFHGCESDEFASNAKGIRPVAYGDTNSPEARYIRRFICPDERTAGTAPAMLQATWRLRRSQDEIRAMIADAPPPAETAAQGDSNAAPQAATYHPKAVFKAHNTEAYILQANYDEKAPRKYTRLHLFGQEGARVMTGKWIASAPAVTMQCLFAQRDAPEGVESMDSAFPAIIELYAGQPVITSQQLLEVKENEADALRAAAVEVKLRDGRVDFCFADGRPDKVRRLANGAEVAGEFAFTSRDAQGLRQATLVGGSRLAVPGLELTPAAPRREAKITKIDYVAKKAWIDQPWPAGLLDGQAAEVGINKRWTTYMLSSVQPAEGGATILFDKHMDYYSSPVVELNEQTGEAVCGLGFPTDDGMRFEGLCDDIVISDEAGKRFWRGKYLGGTRDTGFRFKFAGAVTKADLGLPAGKLRVWEIGAGDTVRLPTHVSLRRLEAGRYELAADVALRLKLAGKALAIAADGKTFKDLPVKTEGGLMAAEIAEHDLDSSGRVTLRVTP